ncbi:MAG: serpin family protein [Planctomycetes bacterium]|nr:serpin family protein [Planctomycetota bacterium]
MNTLLRRLVVSATLCLPLAGQKPTPAAALLANACNRFARDMNHELADAGHPTFSPASVAITLLMLLPGARGDTAKEIADVLHLPPDLRDSRMNTAAVELLETVGIGVKRNPSRPGDGVFRMSNDLWAQSGYPIVPAFANTLRTTFAAASHDMDFAKDPEAARKTINAHVAKTTNGRIAELIPVGLLDSTTRVVLTNALWFKAPWVEPFHQSGTVDAPFTLADGTKVQVPTMNKRDDAAFVESDAWTMVSLPFDGVSIQCDFVVPKDGATIAAAEAALLGDDWRKTKGESVTIALPRFRVRGEHSLAAALKALGIRLAFDPAQADFSGINEKRELFVDELVHQTWIAVDEEGAEAAAATATVWKAGAAAKPREPKVFKADRPFAFALRERGTGLLLFVGRVDDPRTPRD